MNTRIIFKFLIFLAFSFLVVSCQFVRYVIYNFADVNDHKKFPARTLLHSNESFQFARQTSRAEAFVNFGSDSIPLTEYLKKQKTLAFLLIRNDTILIEEYFNSYAKENIVPSFSMAKSFLSALVGCAIKDGYIKSDEESITNYLPEMKKNGFEKVKIFHLLQMTSGLKFNEGYFNPFSQVAGFYYGRKLEKRCTKLKLKAEPGTAFEYTSGSSQLLGLVLKRALGNISLTEYLQKKIWSPLQMEYDASWNIDQNKNGTEKAFCCINARAIDYAKFGRLYLKKGNWQGAQIVPEEWVYKSTHPQKLQGSAAYYQYQWWMNSVSDGDFMAEGILGQYIYVNPKKNIVIVRLGKKTGDVNWGKFFKKISATL